MVWCAYQDYGSGICSGEGTVFRRQRPSTAVLYGECEARVFQQKNLLFGLYLECLVHFITIFLINGNALLLALLGCHFCEDIPFIYGKSTIKYKLTICSYLLPQFAQSLSRLVH